MSEITHQDVLSLHEDATPEKRAILAQKIGYGLQHGSLSETERELALAICQQLAKDIDVTVRTCLSDHLKDCSDLPVEIAHRIADDVLIVSLPFLEVSQALSDEDLIEITKAGSEPRQLAITKRENLGGPVAQTLAELGNEIVVTSLVQNKSAQIDDDALDTVLERFQESNRVHTGIAHRENLSPRIVNKMVDLVTDELKSHLLSNHKISYILAEKLTMMTREEVKHKLEHAPDQIKNTEKLVKNLHHRGKLTNGLIFRALEISDRPFFEFAMALKCNIPVENARKLINDPGDKGFAALYRKANMPKEEFKDVNKMVKTEYHSLNSALTVSAVQPNNWVSEAQSKSDLSKQH